MNQEIIKFEDVSIGYGSNIILKNLNLNIYQNDFIGIVGPNGAGKTTLLKSLLGSLVPISGKIIKNDLQCGYVPQRDIVQPLLPYSVYDVVVMGRYFLMGTFKNPGPEDKRIVEESLDMVGIGHLKDMNYRNLSGGQRQRTLIARALAVKPDILVLDEPTNGMDTPSHHGLLKLISELHDERKLTVVIVSHLLSDVANIVKRLILLERKNIIIGDKEHILSEDYLSKIYSTDIHVSKVGNDYFISTK